MKKVLSIAMLAIILLAVLSGSVSAATKSEMLNQIYSIGAKYGMTSADKVRLERYVNASDVTESQVSTLVSKAQAIATVMDNAGVTKYSNLTEAQKAEVKSLASQGASAVNLSLVFKPSAVDVYKNGVKVESIVENNGKLAYTGSNMNVALIVGSVAVIALLSTAIIKNKIAVAR